MDIVTAVFCLVVAVQDGDSLLCKTAEERISVRLAGIDAPEKRQAFGNRSRQSLTRMTLNKEARLECRKTDLYGRRVCKVFVQPESCPSCGKTLDAGLAQLTQGMAWRYEYHADEQSPQDRGAYEFAQTEARARKAGLWKDRNPVPPWQWRHRRKTQSAHPPSWARH